MQGWTTVFCLNLLCYWSLHSSANLKKSLLFKWKVTCRQDCASCCTELLYRLIMNRTICTMITRSSIHFNVGICGCYSASRVQLLFRTLADTLPQRKGLLTLRWRWTSHPPDEWWRKSEESLAYSGHLFKSERLIVLTFRPWWVLCAINGVEFMLDR